MIAPGIEQPNGRQQLVIVGQPEDVPLAIARLQEITVDTMKMLGFAESGLRRANAALEVPAISVMVSRKLPTVSRQLPLAKNGPSMTNATLVLLAVFAMMRP